MSALFRLDSFGTSKASIKRTFTTWYERPAEDRWATEVKTLLDSPRTTFTLDEIEALLDVFNTSHHQCVLDNPDDFHPLVVLTHKRLDDRIDNWAREVMRLRAAHAVTPRSAGG